jgi:hypothetical protein
MEVACIFFKTTNIFYLKKKCKTNKGRLSFGAPCYPCHVSILMKKIIGLLVKTPKNLYGKRKKHV